MLTSAAKNLRYLRRLCPRIGDGELLKVVREVGFNGKLAGLAIALGFSYKETTAFELSNHTGGDINTRGTMKMLFEWRRNTPIEEQRLILVGALQTSGMCEIADRLERGKLNILVLMN